MSTGPADAALLQAVARHEPLVRETIAFIHAHPELPHQEYASSAHLASLLEGFGFSVERGIAGMDTAFRATLEGGRGGGASVGLVALYDAVASVPPEGGIRAVHSCGHGPISGGVIGAAAALAGHREELAGSVIVMGCPADEIHAPTTVARGSGKSLSADAGAWDDIDAALYAHPEFMHAAWTTSLWMRRLVARVSGTRDLNDGAAQPVLAAAQAAISSVQGLPAGRAMLERLELDGDVESGGGLVSLATFLVWADDEQGLEELAERLAQKLAAEWSIVTTVPSITPDATVSAAVEAAITASGRKVVVDPPALPFATDFGSVTRRVPSALVGVGRAEGWAFHTPEGESQFASEAGVASALGMAQVLALSARRLSGSD